MADYVASLSTSFWKIPPAAVPAMLDCMIAASSTSSSPAYLLSLLLDAFPSLTQEITHGNEKLDLQQCNFIASFVGALCHLLKKSGSDLIVFQHFIWRVLFPLMKSMHTYEREILNKVLRSFLDVVAETNSWGVVEETMVPFFLRLIGLSMGIVQSQEFTVYRWSRQLDQGHDVQLTQIGMNEDSTFTEVGSFSLPMSCHMLTSILDAALQSNLSVGSGCGSILPNGSTVQMFIGNLLWDIGGMIVEMLSQGSEHRSCAITFLLPNVLKAFVTDRAFEISVRGQTFILSRDNFFIRIWKCCKTLFSLGPVERRDAYTALSLYLPFLYKNDGCKVDSAARKEAFDLRSEKEFWDEMKRGLVDKEGIVRKQSLHILKSMLHISENNQPSAGVSETISSGASSVSDGMTKKGRWASKEAKSLGVGQHCNSDDFHLNGHQKWGAFFLLYEMLEEYGTHLVEAAWSYQINLLLHIPVPSGNSLNTSCGGLPRDQMETLEDIFDWLAVLWQRGFCHDNPQVRCLIMQSFLEIEWKNIGNCAKLVPEDFIVGSFLQGLNDPVHHKEFGIKGVYSSRTIEGASDFLQQYTSTLKKRELIAFLINLASLAKTYSFGRVGLMSLAQCIASAACGVQTCINHEVDIYDEPSAPVNTYDSKAKLLDAFRYLIESSKQHFNPNYRLKVSGKVLDAAASVMSVIDVPLELLLHFISALPQDFTDYGGSLRVRVQEWLWSSHEHSSSIDVQLMKSLNDFSGTFVNHGHLVDDIVTYDDEDMEIWELEAKRWARVLFLVIKEEHQLDALLMFIQNHGIDLCKQNSYLRVPVKFLILAMSVVHELQEMKERTVDRCVEGRTKSDLTLLGIANHLSSIEPSKIIETFTKSFSLILDALVSFSKLSCSVFWSSMGKGDSNVPSSIRGKLGGPSQRRLSSSTTTAVLQGITSVKALGSIYSWCAQFGREVSLDSALNFLWQLSYMIIPCSTCNSEAEAEIVLAAYEALTCILRTLVSASTLDLDLLMDNWKTSPLEAEGGPMLDSFLQVFLEHINNLIALGNLARSRRAILMEWKWICLESLLSIPKNALQNGHVQNCGFFFSDAMVRWIFSDLVDSLENAGEGSVLPMLRSVRLIMELFALGRKGSAVSLCNGMDVQMMWHLVQSSWILHTSCNKRRVAPIAALLTSVLHYSVFDDEGMHEIDNAPGPLKWLVDKILEEGTKSPRTIRLAALHLTGLWLSNPSTIKYYMKELKLMTLYGSVAFDEDFEGEVADNHDARSEVSVMAKSPDPELTQEFINTELYARVSVAVMFNKLADLADTVGSKDKSENSIASLQSGKLFLLELLDFAVNDKDLSKELYKKYSAIHRRKIRAWQMICILSRFVDKDTVQKVTCSLHMSLYRNNLPAVRQYLETFAIYLYLKFPSLVREQLVPKLRDYDMRTQALSSYVFIAANVILHATEAVQSRHLDELLPPIIPLLTSHHHSLRAFTQLLVYQVLCKLLPAQDSGASRTICLETKCFVELKSYLNNNSDCARLRTSMEGYLDDFNPESSISPAGIFSNRVEDVEFECAPTSVLERVIDFLNDVRKDLRCSMAKDAATLKNEQLQIDEDPKSFKISSNPSKKEMAAWLPKDISLDFQKKITLSSKHEKQDADSGFRGNDQTYKSLMDVEKEDLLLDQVLHARSVALEKQREGRQHIILVASLLDRIPNLAGLARTCEVFKAACLAIADANVLHDKQFQLISVTAEKWVPIIELPVTNVKVFLEKKKQEGFSILGLEQTANSIPLDNYAFPKKTVLVLGREKEGIPVELIHILDACIEIPQLGVVRSLNVHVSGAIALWEYTRQQRSL